jgi:site-specific DNA recombinase
VYLRISEDRTGLEAGVTRQRQDCERRARDRGWQVAAVHQDNDQSATTGKRRPGFEAMLAAIEAGAVDVVIAWSLDRLQRNRRDEVRLYEACQRHKVTLSLVNGPELDFSTAAGRFVADNLGSVARLEVEMKSDRQRRQVLQAAEQGRRVGGRRPFGYDEKGMETVEVEAQAIRDGYAALLTGASLGEIARDWNRRGLTTGQIGHRSGAAGRWHHDNVRLVLRNPRYCGKRAHNGEIVADAVWAPVVDESTFHAARAILNHPERRRPPRSGRNLLTGLAHCGACDAPVHGGGGVRRGIRNYRCRAASGHIGRMAEPVEDYVEAVMVARLSRADARELLVDQSKPDLDALRTEGRALRSRLDTAAADYADGAITAGQLRTITERIREKLATVEAQMADAGRVDVLGPLVTASDVQAAWDGLSVDRRRRVVDTLAVIRLLPPGRGVRTFRPETVEIEWRTL